MTHINDPAWPHLLTRHPWTVRVVPQDKARVIELQDPTTKEIVGHELNVPRLDIPTDHLIQQHELRHILRNQRRGSAWERTGHKVRDAFRKMIEEAAVEIENMRTGVDTRRCRDNLDFTGLRVRDETDAALWYLQLAATTGDEDAGGTTSPALRVFWAEILATLRPEQHDDLMDLMDKIWIHHANDAALEEATDWIASKFVRTEDPPETVTDAPEPTEEPTEGEDRYGSFDEESETSLGDDEADDDGDTESGDDPAEDDESGDPAREGGEEAGGAGTGGAEPDGADTDGPETETGSPGDEDYEPRPSPHFLEDRPWLREPTLPPEHAEVARAREELAKELSEAEESKLKAMRLSGEVSRYEHLTVRSEFGLIDVHRHTMDRRSSQQFGLAWLPRDSGSQIRYPHRLYPTGRVFAVPAPGGSILVDGSGSMSWHQKTLEQAMESFPNLHCGVYSMHEQHLRGGRVRPFGGFVAKLCVVAAEGRLGKLPGGYGSLLPGCEGHSYGNGDADKACLDYITRHWPRPWVWVSDGGVEAETRDNWQDCDRICRQYKVWRTRTIEDAIAYLAGRAVEGYTSVYGKPTKARRGGPFIQEVRRYV